jgi:hypothetical protein
MYDEATEGRLRKYRLSRPSPVARARLLASVEDHFPSEWRRLWVTLQASVVVLMLAWMGAALSERVVDAQLARLSDRTNPAMAAEREAEVREQVLALLNGASNQQCEEYLAEQLCRAQPRRLVRPPGDGVAFGTCTGLADLMSDSPKEPKRSHRVGPAPPIP